MSYIANDTTVNDDNDCEKNELDKLIYSIHNLINKRKRKFSEIITTDQNNMTKLTDSNEENRETKLDMINTLNNQNRYIKKYKLLLSNLYKNECKLRLTKLKLTNINLCDNMFKEFEISIKDINLLPCLENKIIQLENNQIVFNFNKIRLETHFLNLYNLNIQNILNLYFEY